MLGYGKAMVPGIVSGRKKRGRSVLWNTKTRKDFEGAHSQGHLSFIGHKRNNAILLDTRAVTEKRQNDTNSPTSLPLYVSNLF